MKTVFSRVMRVINNVRAMIEARKTRDVYNNIIVVHLTCACMHACELNKFNSREGECQENKYIGWRKPRRVTEKTTTKGDIKSLARKHVAIVEDENDQNGVPHSIASSIPNCVLSYAGIWLAVM